MSSEKITITQKEKDIIIQILSLEKINNKIDKYSNQDMVNRIINIIEEGVKDEI